MILSVTMTTMDTYISASAFKSAMRRANSGGGSAVGSRSSGIACRADSFHPDVDTDGPTDSIMFSRGSNDRSKIQSINLEMTI
jgi:hypothetical protein